MASLFPTWSHARPHSFACFDKINRYHSKASDPPMFSSSPSQPCRSLPVAALSRMQTVRSAASYLLARSTTWVVRAVFENPTPEQVVRLFGWRWVLFFLRIFRFGLLIFGVSVGKALLGWVFTTRESTATTLFFSSRHRYFRGWCVLDVVVS